MKLDTQKPTYIHDLFINYSRKDKESARRLEKALEDYRPPKDLKVPQRNLDIFCDEEDFTGVEYHHSLEKHLKESAKLIVLCSPKARKSTYVNDEIRRFAEANGADNIIPVLMSGNAHWDENLFWAGRIRNWYGVESRWQVPGNSRQGQLRRFDLQHVASRSNHDRGFVSGCPQSSYTQLHTPGMRNISACRKMPIPSLILIPS